MAPRQRAPRNSPVELGGVTVQPGRRASIELPVARLPTRSWVSLPVVVLCGSRPGPTVWVSAAVHGDELLGVEIIRQVMRGIDPRRLSGTILAVPVVNVPGFLAQSRYTPDRRDLNRSFPGSPRGSLASRLAHLFMTEIVARCDAGLDLHTGSNHRENLPQIRCNTDDPTTLAMAEAFAPPVIVHSKLRAGSLRDACAKRGLPVLLLEAGEALRVQLLHGFNPEGVEMLRDEMLRRFSKITWLPTATIAPVLGAHTGPSMVGMAVAPMELFSNLP